MSTCIHHVGTNRAANIDKSRRILRQTRSKQSVAPAISSESSPSPRHLAPWTRPHITTLPPARSIGCAPLRRAVNMDLGPDHFKYTDPDPQRESSSAAAARGKLVVEAAERTDSAAASIASFQKLHDSASALEQPSGLHDGKCRAAAEKLIVKTLPDDAQIHAQAVQPSRVIAGITDTSTNPLSYAQFFANGMHGAGNPSTHDPFRICLRTFWRFGTRQHHH